jgi:hypothetical protein
LSDSGKNAENPALQGGNNSATKRKSMERKKKINEVDPSEKKLLVRHTSGAEDPTFAAATI